MGNDIFVYTLGFVTARLSAMALFGYAVYRLLRGRHVAVRAGGGRPRSLVSADAVADDRC